MPEVPYTKRYDHLNNLSLLFTCMPLFAGNGGVILSQNIYIGIDLSRVHFVTLFPQVKKIDWARDDILFNIDLS